MNKKALIEQLRRDENGKEKLFRSISDAAKLLGVGRTTMRKMLDGVDYVPSGREKKYFIDDIAEAVISKKTSC